MAITKIKLDNFVVFKHVEVFPGRGINVFIGKNGVGKTQLLKAVYADVSVKNKEKVSFETHGDFVFAAT